MGLDGARFERLVAIMAAMAAGDQAAVFGLYAEFGGQLAGHVRRQLAYLGVHRVDADDLDGLVIDACLALSDCAGAWAPEGGALPWTWAERRLAALVSAWVGQRASPFDAESHDRAGEQPATTAGGGGDAAELEVLAGLARRDQACALLLDALAQVACERDRAIVLELRTQSDAGDPSPATTVARRYGLTPEAVRQVACRVRARLRRLALADARFASLLDLALVA